MKIGNGLEIVANISPTRGYGAYINVRNEDEFMLVAQMPSHTYVIRHKDADSKAFPYSLLVVPCDGEQEEWVKTFLGNNPTCELVGCLDDMVGHGADAAK